MSCCCPSFRVKKLRHRGVKRVVQGHWLFPAKNANCPGNTGSGPRRRGGQLTRSLIWNSGSSSCKCSIEGNTAICLEDKNERGKAVVIENAILIHPYSNNLAGIHLPEVPQGNPMSGQQNEVEFVTCIWGEIWWRLSVQLQFSCFKYVFLYRCHEILKVSVLPFWNSGRKGEWQIWGHNRLGEPNKGLPAVMKPWTALHHNDISKKRNEISNRPLSSNMRPPLVTSLLSWLNNGALSSSQSENKYEKASVNQAKWKGLDLWRAVPRNYQSFQQVNLKG